MIFSTKCANIRTVEMTKTKTKNKKHAKPSGFGMLFCIQFIAPCNFTVVMLTHNTVQRSEVVFDDMRSFPDRRGKVTLTPDKYGIVSGMING